MLRVFDFDRRQDAILNVPGENRYRARNQSTPSPEKPRIACLFSDSDPTSDQLIHPYPAIGHTKCPVTIGRRWRPRCGITERLCGSATKGRQAPPKYHPSGITFGDCRYIREEPLPHGAGEAFGLMEAFQHYHWDLASGLL